MVQEYNLMPLTITPFGLQLANVGLEIKIQNNKILDFVKSPCVGELLRQ
jgi:hypothetical protein